MRIAIYPGSFDPITNGHLDIVKRAVNMFDILYVVILDNPNKKSLFTIEERIEMLEKSLVEYQNVKVDVSNDLAVAYARSKEAQFMVRGLRATNDFEYELNIFALNNHLDADIETVFLMTKLENSFISSSGVKEMAYHQASVDNLVHPFVAQQLKKKFLIKG